MKKGMNVPFNINKQFRDIVMKNKFLVIGSDPECFLRDSRGRLVSSIGVIPGTKDFPTPTKHGSIQPDNITAEFNSLPAYSLEEFIRNHQLIIQDLEDVIKPLDLHLDFVGSVLASKKILSDPAARQAGCSVDYDAWRVCENDPANYNFTSLRAAGGHLHISYDQAVGSPENRIKMVRGLDLVLGVHSVLLDPDNRRCKLYGKAGSFRPKDKADGDPYDGVEYRTLSNFWLKSVDLMTLVYNGVKKVYDNLEEISQIANNNEDRIVYCINNKDKKLAYDLLNLVGV